MSDSNAEQPNDTSQGTDFERESESSQPSLVSEFVAFLAEEKKWWLAPIVVILLLLTLLAWVGGSSLAPFVYPGL